MRIKQFHSLRTLAGQIGALNAGKLAIARLLPRSYETKLTPLGAKHPVYCRSGESSDSLVFRQIFALREYEPLDIKEPRLIIDCGANVGYSTVYFLNRFPQVHVVAVEPDPGNLCLLKKNALPYSPRVDIIEGAVWSSACDLVTVVGAFGDGREWTTTVREAITNERPDTRAFDIAGLIPDGYSRISLLKIDIEGSEVELFGQGFDRWLPLVDNISIELHSQEARTVFLSALGDYDYTVLKSGELTICMNLECKTRSVIGLST